MGEFFCYSCRRHHKDTVKVLAPSGTALCSFCSDKASRQKTKDGKDRSRERIYKIHERYASRKEATRRWEIVPSLGYNRFY
jgi:hypothetical protein